MPDNYSKPLIETRKPYSVLINEHTKIAALLKHHPDALEAIVPLSPDFKKLRNPVLRKLMAGRTSIAMAAKIGACQPQDFYKALKPLGFEVDDSPVLPEQNQPQQPSVPEVLKHLQPEQLVILDVRPMLALGHDPLKLIQQNVKELKQGEILQITNTFEPTPLILLLRKQGFEAFVVHVAPDHIETYFYKTAAAQELPAETEAEIVADWDQLLRQYEGKLDEIDVRHLEMPGPMMAILEALEKLREGRALFVHHKRIPVYLLNELKDRKFDYRIKEVQEGEVYLLIFKSAQL